MNLKFDDSDYQILEQTEDGVTIRFRAFSHIPYVLHPAHPIETLSVYVPEIYYEGKSLHGYDLHSAPIFMPNTVGGYMPGPEEAPGKDMMGRTNAAFYALCHGYVVVSAGARGRGQKNADGTNAAAPADIVDLKAAVRFLHANAGRIPGDVDRIITNGTSAGGAMSALLGTTGNHPDYEPYLASLGAADAPDDVYASSCYCPITDLDHADMAYEWEFAGIRDWHRVMLRFPEEDEADLHDHPDLLGRKKPVPVEVSGELTPLQMELSKELAALFPAWFNSLSLRDETGAVLTMDANGDGPFTEIIEKHILEAADREMKQHGTDLASDPKVRAFLSFSDGKAVSLDWKKFVAYRTRMKQAPAFDDVAMGTAETELFAGPGEKERHFTAFSLEHDTAGGHAAEPMQVKMMNPMYYIDDPKAKKARHFRIRHGAVDRDTSLAVSEMLWLKLKNAGIDADIAHPWGIPHAGDYDLPELFAWIDGIVKEDRQ